MAEGGETTTSFENPAYDPRDDDDDDEQEVNTTQAFQPGAASTPYHGGEQHQMHTFMHEQSGLPGTSYEETPLLSDFSSPEERQSKVREAIDFIKKRYPSVNLKKLGPINFSKKGQQSDIVLFGPKGGENKIFKIDGGFQKSFIDKFSKFLGPSAEEIIAEDRNIILEQRQRVAEAEDQERRANALAEEKEKKEQEIQNLIQQTERVQARIDAIHDEHGSNLEIEKEENRLKQLKKNYQTEFEKKKKELATLEKKFKNFDKAKEKAEKERKKLVEMERKKNTLERLNSTKPLDGLNGRESELKRQNEEEQAIIQDENASLSDKEAAEARVAERNEELGRLQTQIKEREDAMPLRERIREIFKKNGVTLAAVFLAAGITIGAVVGTITNALKTLGKQMGNGLKAVGKQAASALPGLIGSIVSFLFKAAGQAIGYLAEHTWLLILAAVFFIVEKYLKR